jgi:hypothetical protein
MGHFNLVNQYVMKTFIVKYVEDEDESNVKYYQVQASSQKNAYDRVSDYIDENNHHPSINYGYTISTVKSALRIDYVIPIEMDIPTNLPNWADPDK